MTRAITTRILQFQQKNEDFCKILYGGLKIKFILAEKIKDMVKKYDIIIELINYIPCGWCDHCNGKKSCNLYKSYLYNYNRMKKTDLLTKLTTVKCTKISN